MNRSLVSVLFGGALGATSGGGGGGGAPTSPAAVLRNALTLEVAGAVIIVPGCCLPWHRLNTLREVTRVEAGIDVAYAIHPVAGRMPGHMNVLLAEADVLEQLKEMDQINLEFPPLMWCSLGANDVVNSQAKNDSSSRSMACLFLMFRKPARCLWLNAARVLVIPAQERSVRTGQHLDGVRGCQEGAGDLLTELKDFDWARSDASDRTTPSC